MSGFFDNYDPTSGYRSGVQATGETAKTQEYIADDPVRRLQRRVNEMNLQNELKNAPMIQSMFQNLFQGQGTPSGGPTATPTSSQPSNTPGGAGGGPTGINPDQIGKLDSDYNRNIQQMTPKWTQQIQMADAISASSPGVATMIMDTVSSQKAAMKREYESSRSSLLRQMPAPQVTEEKLPDGRIKTTYQDPDTGKWNIKYETPISPKAEQEREKYLDILQKIDTGTATPEEQRFAKAYEKEKSISAAYRVENVRKGQYDLKEGKMKSVSQGAIDADESRYLDPRDPDVRKLQKVADFETPTALFVRTIDSNIKTLKDIEKRYGGNKNPQFINTPINKLQQMMGSGDYASIKTVLDSISGELGKVESGSLGIRGVDVMQFTHYRGNLNENMPLKELIKVTDTAEQLGRNRINNIMDQTIAIKQDMGSKLTPKEENYLSKKEKEIPEESSGEIKSSVPGVTITKRP